MIQQGVNPDAARKIVVNVYRGTAETFDKKFSDDILKRAFADYTGVFSAGLKLQEDLGMVQAIDAATHTDEIALRNNLERIRNAVKEAAEKNSVHYKYWS